MPGFNIGGVGDGPPSGIETLREHRWIITKFGPVEREPIKLAKELKLPEVKIDKLEILGGLIHYKYAKSVKWDDLAVSFYDTGDILPQVNMWVDSVYTNTGGIQVHTPGAGYKQDVIIELLDGAGEVVNTVTLKQAWPTAVSQGPLSYTSSEIKLLSVTLAFDFAIVS